MYNQREHQQKASLVYPEISEKMFTDLDEKAVTELAKAIFLKLPNYRSEVIKILLENKKTQNKMVTTLIGIIKNIDTLELIECTFNAKENNWISENIPASGASKKFFILKVLDLIYENIVNCIYKDESFLIGKFNYDNFFKITMEPNL